MPIFLHINSLNSGENSVEIRKRGQTWNWQISEVSSDSSVLPVINPSL